MSDAMFPCWCYLSVEMKDGTAVLCRYVELPFAPAKGLALVFDDAECDLFFIDYVEYSVRDEAFWLHGGIDRGGCPCGPDEDCCRLKDAVDSLLAAGWEREESVP